MLWTKVSNKYAELFFSDSSDSVFRTYIRLMLLVSSMEVEPNLNQISFKLGKRKVQSLLDYIEKKQEELGKDEVSLDIIVQKVMEDVDAVKQKRDGGKARQKKHRVTHNVTHTDKNKIRTREDKRRVDKTIYCEFENKLLLMWQSLCDSFPKISSIKDIGKTRRSHLKERFKEKVLPERMAEIFKLIAESDFLINGSGEGKHSNWKISFDWLIGNDLNITKILEGKYKSEPKVRVFR